MNLPNTLYLYVALCGRILQGIGSVSTEMHFSLGYKARAVLMKSSTETFVTGTGEMVSVAPYPV